MLRSSEIASPGRPVGRAVGFKSAAWIWAVDRIHARHLGGPHGDMVRALLGRVV